MYMYMQCTDHRYPALLLVGGGIGITPIMGIVKDIYDYGVATTTRTKMHKIDTVYLVWVMPKIDDYKLFRSELDEIVSKSKADNKPKLVLSVYVTRSKECLQPPFYSGRPRMKAMFDSLLANHPDKTALVFACGPPPLVAELWDNSTRCVKAGRRVDFHHEVFDF